MPSCSLGADQCTSVAVLLSSPNGMFPLGDFLRKARSTGDVDAVAFRKHGQRLIRLGVAHRPAFLLRLCACLRKELGHYGDSLTPLHETRRPAEKCGTHWTSLEGPRQQVGTSLMSMFSRRGPCRICEAPPATRESRRCQSSRGTVPLTTLCCQAHSSGGIHEITWKWRTLRRARARNRSNRKV